MWMEILYDVLLEFKILEEPVVELIKDYVEYTDYPLNMTYGNGGERPVSKEAEREMVGILAGKHGLTYLQARRRINKALDVAAQYCSLDAELADGKLASTIKGELEMKARDAKTEEIFGGLYKELVDNFDRDMKIIEVWREKENDTARCANCMIRIYNRAA